MKIKRIILFFFFIIVLLIFFKTFKINNTKKTASNITTHSNKKLNQNEITNEEYKKIVNKQLNKIINQYFSDKKEIQNELNKLKIFSSKWHYYFSYTWNNKKVQDFVKFINKTNILIIKLFYNRINITNSVINYIESYLKNNKNNYLNKILNKWYCIILYDKN